MTSHPSRPSAVADHTTCAHKDVFLARAGGPTTVAPLEKIDPAQLAGMSVCEFQTCKACLSTRQVSFIDGKFVLTAWTAPNLPADFGEGNVS